MRDVLAEYAVPEHLHEGLLNYFERHRPTGGFLRAVLENDMASAVVRADAVSLAGLRDLLLFLVNEAPQGSWGTADRVSRWLAVEAGRAA